MLPHETGEAALPISIQENWAAVRPQPSKQPTHKNISGLANTAGPEMFIFEVFCIPEAQLAARAVWAHSRLPGSERGHSAEPGAGNGTAPSRPLLLL